MGVDWIQRWFGYWGGLAEDGTLLELDSWVDKTWKPEDKDEIVEYLDQAPLMITSAPDLLCFLCEANLGNSSDNRSDGLWVWPKGLVHFVLLHDVKLPEQFVEHIRQMNYRLPKQEDVDWLVLDWPKPKLAE